MKAMNIVVVGGGIIGLAVAAAISRKNKDVYVLERNAKLGQEISTHNSGVIHSGIHNPSNSLKAKMCVRGNAIIYDTCKKYNIAHKKTGKLTLAVEEADLEELEKLMRRGDENGVKGLELLDKNEIKTMEPNVEAENALLSPSSGIVEPDLLMNYYHAVALQNRAVLALNTEVKSVKKVKDLYEIGGISCNEKFTTHARTVINSAGLFSDRIALMLPINIDEAGYRLHYCKGDYYRLYGKPPVKMLVYPVPKEPGLGIHLTPDLSGAVRLGPNAYFVDSIDYPVHSSEQEFRVDVERFLPSIREYEMQFDFAGIRPKLQAQGDRFRDFVIKHEVDKGFFGFINLIGIESPGLTCAPAIGELVTELYEKEIER